MPCILPLGERLNWCTIIRFFKVNRGGWRIFQAGNWTSGLKVSEFYCLTSKMIVSLCLEHNFPNFWGWSHERGGNVFAQFATSEICLWWLWLSAKNLFVSPWICIINPLPNLNLPQKMFRPPKKKCHDLSRLPLQHPLHLGKSNKKKLLDFYLLKLIMLYL